MTLLTMSNPVSSPFNLGPFAPPYSDPTGQARKTDIAGRSMATWTADDIQFVLSEVLGATPRQLDELTQSGVALDWRSLKNYVHSYPLKAHGDGDLTSVQWADFLLFFRGSMLRAEEGPLDRNNLPDLSGILKRFLTVSKTGELTAKEKEYVALFQPENRVEHRAGMGGPPIISRLRDGTMYRYEGDMQIDSVSLEQIDSMSLEDAIKLEQKIGSSPALMEALKKLRV